MAQIKLNATYGLTGTLPAVSAANLTAIPAGNLTGTVADPRNTAVTSSKLTGNLPALNASALTTLNASNVSSGTLNTSRYVDVAGLMTKITKFVVSSASGSIVISNCFSTTYKNYFVTFENVKVNTSQADMRFKFFQANGTTSDGVSGGGLLGRRYSGTQLSEDWVNSNNATIATNVYNANGINVHMYCFRPKSTESGSSQQQWQVSYREGSSSYSGFVSGGNVMLTTHEHTGFYFHTSTGTFTAGEITVYGITNP